MSSWKKVRDLFWQPAADASAQEPPLDAELAELLGAAMSPTGMSPAGMSPAGMSPAGGAAGVGATLGAGYAMTGSGAVESASLDFQAQYDLAGIPNTDEVEQLESFLNRLDDSLPQSSKLAAARAFLGAVGKDKEDVLRDAALKLQCVRAIAAQKADETELALNEARGQLEALQAQMEEHRKQMEALTAELEGVRSACRTEEARLQVARVFFGGLEPSAPHS
ncbi:MAG: hypothetical protein RL685_522 [Pseudomonadota bacterium]